MTEKINKIMGISCSIFRKEIELLQKQNKINIPVIYLDSMQHMYPDQLHENMERVVKEELDKGNKVALIYGECQPFILDYKDNLNISRITGMNCIEIFLGKELYRSMRKSGAFFLLPEWTKRWKEIFQQELGLNGRNAQDFMREMHTKLVYLDTGVYPVPSEILQEISDYTSLPYEILPVSLEHFSKIFEEIIERLS